MLVHNNLHLILPYVLYPNFDMSILQSHFIEVYKSFVPISIKLFHQFHEPVAECAIFTSPVF